MRRIDTFILACGIVLAALILRPILDESPPPAQPQPAEADAQIQLASWTDDDAELSEFAALLEIDPQERDFDRRAGAPDEPAQRGDHRREGGPDRSWDGRDGDRGRGGRGGRGRDGRGRRPIQLSEDMIDRCIEVANEVRPELAERLVKMRETNAEEFTRTMRSTARGLLSLAEMKERNPDLYLLKLNELRNDVELHQLAGQWRKALAANDTTLAKELEDQLLLKIRFQMALRIKSKLDLLTRFEERVVEMRTQFDGESKDFESMVEERLRTLRTPTARGAVEAEPAAPTSGAG